MQDDRRRCTTSALHFVNLAAMPQGGGLHPCRGGFVRNSEDGYFVEHLLRGLSTLFADFLTMDSRALSPNFVCKIAKGQMQVLRLTTPKLKGVWGPFRSGRQVILCCGLYGQDTRAVRGLGHTSMEHCVFTERTK